MNLKTCRRLPVATLLALVLPGLMLVLVLAACRGFDNPFDPANNRPPDVPANPNPPDGANRQDTVGVTLTWTCSDPDSAFGDSLLTYDVHFGTADPPPLVEAGHFFPQWPCGNLGIGVTYHWRIIARDSRGDTTAGPVWSFATNPNLKPHVPSGPRPANDASGQPSSLTLAWQGGDPNPGDSVYYDVYLGITTPPPLYATGLVQTQLTVAGLGYNTTYNWQVVARDQDGAETSGPAWRFVTMERPLFSSPAGGERWRIGTLRRLSWSGGTFAQATPHPGPAARKGVAEAGPFVKTTPGRSPLHSLSPDSTVLFHSADSGANWNRLGRAELPGQYDWTVTGPATRNAMIRLRFHVGEAVEEASSARFIAYDLPTPVNVTAPASGEVWEAGSVETIRWTGGTGIIDSTVIHYSRDNGRTWSRQGRATETGRFEWTVPEPASESAYVRVRAHIGDDHASGTSGRFEIRSPIAPVVVLAPLDTTRWRMLSYETVRWEGGPTEPDSVLVYFRPTPGGQWQRQAAVQGNSYLWLVPGPPTTDAQVEIRAWRHGNPTTGTSPEFTIYDTLTPVPPVVTSPAGGERWEVGSEQTITWNGGTDGMDSTVILLSTNDGTTWLRQGVTTQPGRYRWTVPGTVTDEARIGIQAWCTGRRAEGVSNRFRITGPPYPDSVLTTVTVGDRPTALAWNATNSRLYVANRNSGTVSVIDGATNSVIATVPVASAPAALAWDSLHNKVYCVNEGSRSVTVIDGAGNSVVATVPTGAAPRDVCLNPVSGKVYVANYGSGANSVTVIDAAGDSVLATVTTGQRPRALAWNPVNNRVYVACFSSNSVTVIDGETNAVVDSVGVGWSPAAVAVVEDQNHIYVANSGSASNSVTVMDGATNTVIQHVAVGAKPAAVGWNSTGNKVYVANEDAGSVSVIRTTDRQVVAVIGTGSQPCAVRWLGSSNMAYVPCRGSAQLAIINGSSDSRQKLLSVGGEPAAVAADHTGSRVYTADYADGTVTVIGHE
ncbi:MAG TPA: YncE family protein [candidate division WOR-3 bacterium]|uniref:YncE family protein n=1 Tax=candidate division WOR-3 bacterium TaxID=2052148 RepID=A0A7V0T437_UNCW3|nr:YncE family protein [candidate division WOR-3 bacterium]